MPIVTNINLPTPAIAAAHARWAKNRAFLNGEEAVKAQRREFLPPANPADTDAEYDAFLQRTRFLPAAAKIAQGLCGLIARKKAQLNTTSARIQLLTQLISPDGQSLDELSEWVVLETLITNFTGLLVDHPDRNGFTGLSAANEIEQGYRPRLAGYCGESILEVTPGLVNNQRQIVRVRLLEDEGNTVRELMLNNGIYQVRVWTKQNGAFVPGAITTPIRGTEPLTEIPFVLVSTSDKLTPTPSLLQHSVDLNLQHYRVQGLLTSVLYFLSAPIGATPKNKISADVVMPGAATVAAAATALLKTAGVPNARISDFSAFQQTWSLYQTEQVTVGDAVRDCLYQAGGYIIPDGAGVWQVGDYFASKAATAISTDGTLPLVLDVKELNAAAPVYKVKIGFDRCWGVHSDSDVSPALAEVSDANEANAEAIEEAAELAAQAAADAAAAKVRLDALVSDGILDRSEKAQIVREFQQEAAQQTGLVNQGSALNVTAEKNALVTAFGNLSGYLNSLSPAYTDGSQDTVIDRNEWNARWGDYYVAKQNLTNALAGKAATTSTWSGVSGTGKPVDYADVTAQNTAKDTSAVAGVPAGTLVDTANNANANANTAIGALKNDQGTIVTVRDLLAADSALSQKAEQDLNAAKTQLSSDIATTRSDLTVSIADAKKAGTDASAQAATARQEAAQVRTDLTPLIADAKKAGTDAAAAGQQISTDLATEVNRAKGAEGTLTTKVETAQGRADAAHTAISTETTQRVDGDNALGQRIDSLTTTVGGNTTSISTEITARTNADNALGQRIDTLKTTVDGNTTAISDEARARSDADGALGSRVATIETSSRGAGNLLTNTDFANGSYTGWTFVTPSGAYDNLGVNTPDDGWHPRGENVIGFRQTSRIGGFGLFSGGGFSSAPFTVQGGEWLQAYVYAATHDCQVEVRFLWLDANNNEITSHYTGGLSVASGGVTPESFTRVGFLSVQAPAGAVSAKLDLSKWNSPNSPDDSWVWFWRPYVGYARQGQNEWNPYSPGSAKAAIVAANARIGDEATARSNADGALGQRIDSVIAQANTDRGDYTGKINDEALARSNADGALATRANNLEANARANALSVLPVNMRNPTQFTGDEQAENPGSWFDVADPHFTVNGEQVPVFITDPGQNIAFATRANFKPVAGRTYRVTWKVRRFNEPTSGTCLVHPGFCVMLENGSISYANDTLQWNQLSGDYLNYDNLVYEWTPGRDVRWARPRIHLNNGGAPGARFMVSGMSLEDITDVKAANVRIGTEETARSNADLALGNRISTIEADYVTNGAAASIAQAKVNDEATARSNADSALAGRTTRIETSFNRTRESLLPTNFEGQSSDWGRDGSGAFYFEDHSTSTGWDRSPGLVMVWNGESDQYIYPLLDGAQLIPVQPGQKYRLTASVAMWGGNGSDIFVYFDVHGRDRGYRGNGGGITPPGCQNHINIGPDNQWHEVTAEAVVPQDIFFLRPILHVRGGGGFVRKFSVQETTAVALADARITDEATARSNADGALSGRIQTIEADYVTNGAAQNIAQAKVNDEATARSNADGALGGRISTIETSATNAGNLLSNTTLTTLDGWHLTGSVNGAWMARNDAGPAWMIGGVENNLTLRGAYTGGIVAEAQSDKFAVQPGAWYQAYALTANHRCRAWVSMFFFDSNGAMAGYAGEHTGDRINAGGQDIGAHDITGVKAVQAPSNARSATIVFRMYDADADGFAWFSRPYVGAVKSNTNEWNDYTPGNAGALIAATNTKISDEVTARSNADSALGGRIQTIEADYVTNGAAQNIAQAKVNDEATARSNADGALSGRISTTEAKLTATPVSFIARSVGYAAYGDAPFASCGIARADGTNIAANGRSYGVYVFNSTNTLIAANSYDVYGDGNASAAMANFLNGITKGQAVIVTTNDEPATNRLNNGLQAAMERCGAGSVFSNPKSFWSHSAYILIGRAGIGKGNGQEFFRGDYNGAPNSWLEQRFDLLNGVPQIGSSGTVQVTARVEAEETARSDADGALSGRISTTEAKLNLDQDSNLYARIRSEENARAAGDASIAQRTQYLESTASLSAGVLNPNANFTAWPDGQQLPSYWQWWNADGLESISRPASEVFPGWAARINARGGQNCGFAQMDGNGPDITPGWYVMEADVRLESGSWNGSGLTVQGVYNLHFGSESDTAGGGANSTYIGRRRFTKLFKCEMNLRNWHAMTNWSAWPMEAKQMVWYRAAIRPASDAEIQAGRATGDISSLTSRIQTEETTRANAVQAVANRTAVVEAQVTSDANNLVRNPTFNAPGWQTGVSGIPLYWGGWAQDNGAYIGASDRRSNYGAAAPLQIDRNGNNNGISQNLGTQAAGWYVLEADITAEDGNWLGCGVHINFNNGYSRNFDFGREADTNGGVVAGNIGSVNRKFSTMFYNGNVGTNVSFYLMAGWEGFATGQGFLRTIWHRAVVRAATDAEIKAQKVIDSNLMARVTTTEQTLAQAGNLAASWKISAETPGASAFITAQAKTSNGVAVSNVSIGGTAINLVNTDGSGVKKGLAVENGTVTVYGALRAGAAIMQGSGTGWPVALASKDFNVSNGDYVAFGTTLDSLPNLTFAGNGLVALNSGETYRLYAENLTRDGFTARLEISVPAQPSNYDLTSGQYSGSGLRIIDKYPRPDSTSNTYNVTVTGTITATAYNNGDTYCIWTEAYTYSGKKGYELQSGDMLMVLEDDGSYAPAPIEEIAFNREDCITLRSASGIELTVSKSTPVTLRDGTSIKALAVQGHELPVMDGDDFRWEEIVAVEEAGVRPVARIYVGDRTFAAGNAMGRSIFTHNAPVNKL